MNEENRRSFVKKSIATSMTVTFSGLIRAHGEGFGATITTNSGESTFATTEGGDTTTWNPDETTVGTTAEETTLDTTISIFSCNKTCDNNPQPLLGLGDIQKWGSMPAPTPGNPTRRKFFPLVKCKCTNGHEMGVFRDASLETFTEPTSVPIHAYGASDDPTDPAPAPHTQDHGPCGQ